MTAREDFLLSLAILQDEQNLALIDLNAVFVAADFDALKASIQTAIAKTVPQGEIERVLQDTMNCLANCATYVASKVEVLTPTPPPPESP